MTPGLILVATVATVYIVYSLTRWNGGVSVFRQILLICALGFDIWFAALWVGAPLPWWLPTVGVALVWAIVAGLTRRKRY